MPFKPGNNMNPKGRPKGSISKKKRAALARQAEAASIAGAITALATSPVASTGVRPNGRKVGRIDTERPGINSKALLNTAMRIAWEAYHGHTAQAAALDQKLAVMQANVAALEPDATISEDKRLEDLRGRQAVGQEACQQIRNEINDIRAKARAALGDATNWAKDVSPYEFPRLMTQNGSIDANLTITIKKYSAKAPGPVAKVAT